MKQYTEQELDEKIHTFIASKMDQFPELAVAKQSDTKHMPRVDKKLSAVPGLFLNQLELSFK